MQNIGINDRVIAQMSEIEKRLLIVITLQNQMYNSGAVGDYGRTIDYTANQIKVFQQQVSELGRALSSVFYGIIGGIMPYINGFIMAIRSLIQTFASFLGYKMPDSTGIIDDVLAGYGDEMDNFGSSVDDTNESLGGTAEKLKEIEGQLASFDKLNVIQQPTDNASGGSGGGGAGGGFGGIDSRLLDALNNMNYKFQEADMLANKIRDRLLEWADILGNKINDNIFEPIQNSWDKYGESIFDNFSSGFGNLKILASDFIDTWSSNWKSNFQAVSDLFFSLLDTAGLVFNTITDFMLDVWNKGGKDLYNSLNELGRSFVRLATKINDEFIKPVIKWFKNNLSDGISTAIGNCMKIVSGLVSLFADFVNFLSQKGNPTLQIFVGIWASWKATKVISDVNKLTSAIKLVNPVVGGFATQAILADSKVGILSKTITKLTQFFKLLVTDGFSKAISVFPSLNNVWSTSVSFVNKYASSLGEALTKMSSFTSGIPILSTGLGKIGSALSSASFGPWAIGIGVATTAIVGLVSYLGHLETETEKVDKRLKEFSEKRNKELEDFRENTKQNIETGLEETLMFERNVERLKELVDENGKLVGSKDELRSVVKQINDVAPDTIKWINDETIAIEGGIDSLKDYVLKKKAQIIVDAELEASAKALIKIRKLEDENDELIAERKELRAKREQALAIISAGLSANASKEEKQKYLNSLSFIEGYETKLRELNGEINTNTDTINGYKAEMAQADADAMALMNENANGYSLVVDKMASLVTTTYENMQTSTASERGKMLEKEKTYLDELSDANVRASKGITDEQYAYLQQQYQNHETWNGEILEAERIKNYDQLNLLKDLTKNTNQETLDLLVNVWKNYKDYGYNSGQEFITKLQEEMAKNGGVLDEATLTALGIKGKIEGESYNATVKTNVDTYALNGAVTTIKNAFSGISFKVGGSVLAGIGLQAQGFATGGFPNAKDIFYANEGGKSELIGRIGNKHTVVNEKQVVDVILGAMERKGVLNGGLGVINLNATLEVNKRELAKIQKKINLDDFLKTGKKK